MTETQPPRTMAKSEQTFPAADGHVQVADALEHSSDGERGEESVSQKKKPISFYLAFIGININAFVYSLDATTLAVAIPSITASNHGTSLQSFWASLSYLLLVVATQPLYTTLSDVFGRKAPLYAAFVFFFAGSLVFALAENITLVIVGRVLQGLGGGGLDLLGEIIIADITTLKERSLYLGILALPTALGSTAGPSLGAVFSSLITWHWIGWVNLPLLGTSFFLILFFLKLRPIEQDFSVKVRRLDWGGIVLSTAGITLFVLPISWAGALYEWRSPQTLVPLFVGAALLAVFVVYESKPEAPIVPHRLCYSATARWTLLGNFVEGVSLFTLLQYLPLFYQAVQLQTVIGSAVTLLSTSVVSVVAAVCAVIAVGVVGKGYRAAIQFCWVLLTVGTGLLSLLDSSSSMAMQIGLPVIWGAGVGALLRLLHLPMQASVKDVDDTGLAIGLLLTIRLLGGLVGLAIGSSIFSNVFTSSIAAIDSLPDPLAVLNDARQAVGFIPMLRTVDVSRADLELVIDAYAKAMHTIFYVMTAFGGIGLLSSIFTKELTLERSDLGRQRLDAK